MGASLLADTLTAYAADDITPIPQDHDQATMAPMLSKKDGRIDWHMPADAIDAFIRGMNPWPGAFTFLENRRLQIYMARSIQTEAVASPGTVIKGFADELRVAAGKGALSILELQGDSGKRLPVRSFLQGCPLSPGNRFT
jgi:methionyl-tRNA formyltransferase